MDKDLLADSMGFSGADDPTKLTLIWKNGSTQLSFKLRGGSDLWHQSMQQDSWGQGGSMFVFHKAVN